MPKYRLYNEKGIVINKWYRKLCRKCEEKYRTRLRRSRICFDCQQRKQHKSKEYKSYFKRGWKDEKVKSI